MSIEVKKVSKYYGQQAALDEVNFSIGKGEVVGFLGPNGAGKSTMMKIISCYLPPSEGDVKVAGYDIFDQSIKVRQKVGYLPETNPLYPEMYIREYLRFVAGIYKLKNKSSAIDKMIETVGLQKEAHKKIGQISKGYKQRVGLAQALIHDPDVLILDEPTSGLDPNQLEDIRQLIRKIGSEKTVLLSTHIMQEVEAICDRVIIINQGKIVADNSVLKLKEERDVDVLVVSTNKGLNLERLQKLEGVVKIQNIEKGKLRIFSERGIVLGPKITALASEEGIEIEELRKEERTLEDVFKSLTK